MKMKKISIIMLMGVSILMINGCAKKKGCTDSSAVNFDSSAQKDDGSCTYQGKSTFWYGKNASDSLAAHGATALTYYLDGIIIGSSAASVYFTSSPACGQSGTISVTKSLGSVKSKSFPYVIKDQNGIAWWTGNLSLDASQSCTLTELTF